MQEIMNPDLMNTIYWILAIGVGWIVLRFLFKLAKKIFAVGCFAIIVIAVLLVVAQYIQGV